MFIVGEFFTTKRRYYINMGGRGNSGSRNAVAYPEQTFKRTKARFGNTEYESELFRINSYTRNTPGTSWKSSGYTLSIKGTWGKSTNFDTLKDAKAFVASREGQEWYLNNRKDK